MGGSPAATATANFQIATTPRRGRRHRPGAAPSAPTGRPTPTTRATTPRPHREEQPRKRSRPLAVERVARVPAACHQCSGGPGVSARGRPRSTGALRGSNTGAGPPPNVGGEGRPAGGGAPPPRPPPARPWRAAGTATATAAAPRAVGAPLAARGGRVRQCRSRGRSWRHSGLCTCDTLHRQWPAALPVLLHPDGKGFITWLTSESSIADPPILSSSTRNGSWRYGSCGTGHVLVKRSGKQLLSTNLRRPIGSPTATSVQNRDPSFS